MDQIAKDFVRNAAPTTIDRIVKDVIVNALMDAIEYAEPKMDITDEGGPDAAMKVVTGCQEALRLLGVPQ